MPSLLQFAIPFSILVLLSSCVTRKVYDEEVGRYETALSMVIDSLDQRDSIIFALEESLVQEQGGNSYLLQSQENLQNRLEEQALRIEELQGNVSNTQSSLSAEIETLRTQRTRAVEQFDLLLADYGQAQEQFQATTDRLVAQLEAQLRAELPENSIRNRSRAGSGASSFVVQEDVLFQRNSTNRLTSNAEAILTAIAEALEANPLLKLRIEGHTDNGRRSGGNWQFAALRATHLAKILTDDYYLSANRLTASSHGEYAPLTSNATEDGRRINRRIEFVFQNELSNLLREFDRISTEVQSGNE